MSDLGLRRPSVATSCYSTTPGVLRLISGFPISLPLLLAASLQHSMAPARIRYVRLDKHIRDHLGRS